ncbi:MAG: hypothetical protein QM793_10515 [Muricomes sp.]
MNEFQEVIQKLILLFQELTSIESKMLDAAKGEHIAVLESHMLKEQAAIMQLRGLEREKDRVQAELGYDGLSFHEILEKLSEEERTHFLPLFDGLSREIQMFQEVHEDLTLIMEVNLRNLNKKLNNTESQVYPGNRTDSKGLII